MNINKVIKIKNKYKTEIYISLIIFLAFYLRTFNINWDNNYYFHPDERAIVMFTIPLQFPKNLNEFLSINSPLNPHFFAYGNLPLYLLRILAEIGSHINPILKAYGGIHIIGRLISAIADTLSVFVIFIMASKLFSKQTGLFAALIYALSVFPIQASHFYTVDTLLTLFTTTTILCLISFFRKPSSLASIMIGIFFGLSLATKISAAVFAIDIFAVLLYIFFTNKKKRKTLFFSLQIILFTFLVFVITQPYTLIDLKSFIYQTRLQSQMSNNPFLFPYTLQYVGKIPYFYELKNIFLWGEGPIIALLNFIGIGFVVLKLKNGDIKKRASYGFTLFVFISYFIIFGSFAVGWMRYMLPIYPLLSVFGGILISEFIIPKIPKKYLNNYFYRKVLLLLFLVIISAYTTSFLSIYLHPNTRIQASEWINKNIPVGKSVAVEHWDDALPVFGGENYKQLTLPLYDPDTQQKWVGINATLNNTDYIFIASNRLYKPIERLTNCKNLPQERCYPITSAYYKNLFSGKLKFEKIAEFTDYPTIPFTNIELIDDNADESFTVYDHPKIMLFKKD